MSDMGGMNEGEGQRRGRQGGGGVCTVDALDEENGDETDDDAEGDEGEHGNQALKPSCWLLSEQGGG